MYTYGSFIDDVDSRLGALTRCTNRRVIDENRRAKEELWTVLELRIENVQNSENACSMHTQRLMQLVANVIQIDYSGSRKRIAVVCYTRYTQPK